MKNWIVLIVFFASVISNAQDLTIIHINAKWNIRNDYKQVEDLKGVKIQYGYLDDQVPSIKKSIKSVPTVILMKSGRPIYIWNADISFKIKTPIGEIQKVINEHRFIKRRQSVLAE